MSRIAGVFTPSHPAPRLVTYVTAGDPDAVRSREILLALAAGGADIIEVGVPFSDPIADGPAIQRAQDRALSGGMSLARTLDLVADVRRHIDTPIVLFTYVNPVSRFGFEAFAARASAAGVDGVLLLDLPIEEAGSVHDVLAGHRIDQIFLVSPTTTDERLATAGRYGSGFLYAISRLGVTGARTTVAATAAPLVARVRRTTSLPVALGFGISRPEHVREVSAYADGVVVGSALVELIERTTEAGGDVASAVRTFVQEMKGVSGAIG
jgi:tryptophan synthase alpha chain